MEKDWKNGKRKIGRMKKGKNGRMEKEILEE